MTSTRRPDVMLTPTRAPRVLAPTARPAATASMISLQRSAGNTSTLALLRRARKPAEESPATLTLPGVLDHATVSSWSITTNGRGQTSELQFTRPTDAESPALAKALTGGTPGGPATLVVRRLTPLGWIHKLTLTMEDCMVSSFSPGGEYESVTLAFSRMHFEE